MVRKTSDKERSDKPDGNVEESGVDILKSVQIGIYTSLSIPKRSPALSVCFGIVVTILALLTSYFIPPAFKEEFTYLFLFIAVASSLWFSGIFGGIGSLLFGSFVSFYFLFLPLYSFRNFAKDVHAVIFLANGILLIGLYGIGVYQRRKIRTSEKNKAEIINHVPFGLILFNEEKKVVDGNHEVEKLFGMSIRSLKNRLFNELIHSTEVYEYNKNYETVAITAHGREFPIELRLLNPSYFEQKKMYVCIIRDITVQKNMEEKQAKALSAEHSARLQAEEEVRAREEFLSIASHELKNPLTSMLLQIQGILHNVRHVSLAEFSIDKMMRMLESSEQQSRRLNRMISDLLNVSLITTGRLDLELEKANLTNIAKDVAMRFIEQFERTKSTFTLKAEKPIEIQVDKLRIEQVLTNLLSNAIKYGNGKPVEMTVEKIGSQAVIEVVDHGIGIPPENLERIFNRFERAVDAREYKGLGVGLYIAMQIVKAHKGSVKVKSHIGQGSTFIIELPLAR